MFCCELKFVINIYRKWTYTKFKAKNLALDLTSKTQFKNENKLCYINPYVICGLSLSNSAGKQFKQAVLL